MNFRKILCVLFDVHTWRLLTIVFHKDGKSFPGGKYSYTCNNCGKVLTIKRTSL